MRKDITAHRWHEAASTILYGRLSYSSLGERVELTPQALVGHE